MRKLLFLFITLFYTLFSNAQSVVPQEINYQAVVRDSDGVPATAGGPVNFTITFLDKDGNDLAIEFVNTTIQKFGVVSFGLNTEKITDKSKIHTIRVEEGTYGLIGETKMSSVPYALYAEGASVSDSVKGVNVTVLQEFKEGDRDSIFQEIQNTNNVLTTKVDLVIFNDSLTILNNELTVINATLGEKLDTVDFKTYQTNTNTTITNLNTVVDNKLETTTFEDHPSNQITDEHIQKLESLAERDTVYKDTSISVSDKNNWNRKVDSLSFQDLEAVGNIEQTDIDNWNNYNDTKLSAFQVDSIVASEGYIKSFTEVDGDATNEIQKLSISGNRISLSEGGDFVDLPSGTVDTDRQDLIVTVDSLKITGGNGVLLSEVDTKLTDQEVKSIVASEGYLTSESDPVFELSLASDITALDTTRWGTGDNLGNHTLDSNFRTNGYWLSNNGDDEGLFIDAGGNVGLGRKNPNKELDIIVKGNHGGIDIQQLNANDTIGISFRENGSWYRSRIYRDEPGNLVFAVNENTTEFPEQLIDRMKIGTNGKVTIPDLTSGMVVSNATGQLSTQTIPTADNWGNDVVISNTTLSGNGTSASPLAVDGDLTDNQNIAGSGLAGTELTIGIQGGNSQVIDLADLTVDSTDANNGLIMNGDIVELGGTLNRATIITQGGNDLTYNLNGVGVTAFNSTRNNRTPYVEITNSNNTNSTGDAALLFETLNGTNTHNFTIGIDETDKSFKIADFSELGTNDRLIIAGNGIVSIPNLTSGMVVSNASGQLSTQTIPTADNWGNDVVISNTTLSGNGTTASPLAVDGDLTDNQNIAGSGLAGTNLTIGIQGGTNQVVSLATLANQADNGLIMNGETVELGGTLTNTLTTLTTGTNTFRIDSRTGLFRIQDGNQGDGKVLTSDGSGYASWQPSASGADNLGNHIAEQNIQLAGNWLSNDGGDEGVFVSADGTVGVGTKSTGKPLMIKGDALNGLIGLHDSGNEIEWHMQLQGTGGGNLGFTESGISNNRLVLEAGGNVGIGTDDPTSTLDVDGTIRIRGGSPQANYVLTSSDADGNATWEAIPAQGDITAISATDGLGGFGLNSGTATVFAKAGNGLNVSAQANRDQIELGGALDTNTAITQGAYNFDINLNGTGDFAVQSAGADALFVRQDGNVGIGTNTPDEKLHVLNSGNNVGPQVIIENNNGGNVGDASLYFHTSRSSGTIDEDYTIGIDENGGSTVFKISNNSNISSTTHDRLVIDGTGNVGVGTTSPSQKLEVNGTTRVTMPDNPNKYIEFSQIGDNSSINVSTGSDLKLQVGGSNVMVLNPAGQVSLTVADGDGSAIFFGTLADDDAWGGIRTNSSGGAPSFFNGSDRRIKMNIQKSPSVLNKIMSLSIVKYDYKKGGHVNYGVIAQELYDIFPDKVQKTDNGIDSLDASTEPWSVSVDYQYELIKSIQEQQVQIDELKNKNSELENSNQNYDQRIQNLEASLSSQETEEQKVNDLIKQLQERLLLLEASKTVGEK